MESLSGLLIVWLLLAVVLVIYVVYRILSDGRSSSAKKHSLYPLVSADGDLMFPPKGDYFTWTLYLSWVLALLAVGVCALFQAFDHPVPGYMAIAVNAVFLAAVGLLGFKILQGKRKTKVE